MLQFNALALIKAKRETEREREREEEEVERDRRGKIKEILVLFSFLKMHLKSFYKKTKDDSNFKVERQSERMKEK